MAKKFKTGTDLTVAEYEYLENNHYLIEKLWTLEFGVSIHS